MLIGGDISMTLEVTLVFQCLFTFGLIFPLRQLAEI